jgi:cell division protein FtsA
MLFRSKETTLVAVEAGTSKMVVAVGHVRNDGVLKVLGLGESSSAGVRKGDIFDPKAASDALREAMAKAEENADVVIHEAFVALSGAHLECVSQRGSTMISQEKRVVTEEDVDEARSSAEEMSLPEDRCHVATLPKGFSIDGGPRVGDPVGMNGAQVEGEFLIVHGVTSRLHNVMDRVRELQIEVCDFSLSPMASAEAVLSEEQKRLGALVIDLGGGLTHFSVYHNGQIESLGVLGVGGDHVTQDLSRAFNLPLRLSEDLKCSEGAVVGEAEAKDEIISLKPMSGFAGKSIYRESLIKVMRARWEETLLIIKKQLGENFLDLLSAGVFLTGGGSRTQGIKSLTETIFQLPVTLVREHAFNGNVGELARPELSTVLGVLLLGQKRVLQERGDASLGQRFSRALKKMKLIV